MQAASVVHLGDPPVATNIFTLDGDSIVDQKLFFEMLDNVSVRRLCKPHDYLHQKRH